MTEEERKQLEAQGFDAKDIELLATMNLGQAQAVGYARVEQSLFPGGIPAGATAQPLMGALSSPTGPVPLPEYVDPNTGAIRRTNGVLVDPTGDPTTGVYIDPRSDVKGSFKWLNSVQKKWDESTTNKWRKRLYALGYDVAKEGKFDVTLRNALDMYFKRQYFYGEDIPADSSSGGRPTPEEVYDPVLIRNDIRTGYLRALGREPSAAEEKEWEEVWKGSLQRMLDRGVSPEHAQLKAQEQFSKDFAADPVVKEFGKREARVEENTQLHDSLLSLSQIMGA